MLKAQEILKENGIESGETSAVLQAIGYAFNVELENLIDWEK